eukprot:TRINITY_DN969_c0_g1_i11.p1 TRINITY_DN969_c0_g1~~TRINITY_DN969_c0_g1_i11.p1  ORF type:complete len:113 (+),score=24.18 TRINITY_DN969_c0_g1_i11:94-432(+)
MKNMKELFVDGVNYGRYRPTYPPALYNHIREKMGLKGNERAKMALDVGCGSGQVTVELLSLCEKVKGIDISEGQLKGAIQKDGIIYDIGTSNNLPVENQSLDLITVGQAAHW